MMKNFLASTAMKTGWQTTGIGTVGGAAAGGIYGMFSEDSPTLGSAFRGAVLGAAGGAGAKILSHKYVQGVKANSHLARQHFDYGVSKQNAYLSKMEFPEWEMDNMDWNVLKNTQFWDSNYASPEAMRSTDVFRHHLSNVESPMAALTTPSSQFWGDMHNWFGRKDASLMTDPFLNWSRKANETLNESFGAEASRVASGFDSWKMGSDGAVRRMPGATPKGKQVTQDWFSTVGDKLSYNANSAWQNDPLLRPFYDHNVTRDVSLGKNVNEVRSGKIQGAW